MKKTFGNIALIGATFLISGAITFGITGAANATTVVSDEPVAIVAVTGSGGILAE